MDWRFINSGFSDAYTNMAIDEAILKLYDKNKNQPVLRIYGWNPPGVSLGYFQEVSKAVNIEKCEESGVDIVRRLTGGRAVLHEDEITYSVIIGENYPGLPQTVTDSYKFICKGIIEGLKIAGADVSMEQGRKKNTEKGSSVCFDSPSMYEIIFEGKKLVGSAQARKNGVILQHGSILLGVNIEKQMKIFKFNNDVQKEKVECQLKNKVTSLKDILGFRQNTDLIIDCLLTGYKKVNGINFINDKLSKDEEELAEELKQVLKFKGRFNSR